MSANQTPQRLQSPQDRCKSVHEANNIFNAIKTLKTHQQQVANLQNRIRILQQKQLNQLKKLQKHQYMISSIQKIRDDHKHQRQKYSFYKQQIRNQVAQQHRKNKEINQEKQNKIDSIFKDIKNKRLSTYQFMKKKREQNEIKVQKIKELDLNIKKQMRDKVVSEECQMKKSKIRKNELRNENISNDNQSQVKVFTDKAKQQHEQINKLARLQLQLINRNSQSQVKSNEVKERYQKYVKENKLSTLSLVRKKESEGYVHPLIKRIEKRVDKYHIDK